MMNNSGYSEAAGLGLGDEADDMPSTEKDLAEDAPWKKIQQNTFTRWCNEHLKCVGKRLTDLQRDLSDGLRLIALLEVLSQKRMYRKFHPRPNFRQMKLENVSVALEFLEREHIKLVSIGQCGRGAGSVPRTGWPVGTRDTGAGGGGERRAAPGTGRGPWPRPSSHRRRPHGDCLHAPLCTAAAARDAGRVQGPPASPTRSHLLAFAHSPHSCHRATPAVLERTGAVPITDSWGHLPPNKAAASQPRSSSKGWSGLKASPNYCGSRGSGADREPVAPMCSAAGFRPGAGAGRAQPQKPKKALSECGSLNPRLSSSCSACRGGGSSRPCPAPALAPAHPLSWDWLRLTGLCRREGGEGL